MIEGMSKCFTLCECFTIANILTHVMNVISISYYPKYEGDAILTYLPIVFLTCLVLIYRVIAKILGKGSKEMYYNFTSSVSSIALVICLISLCLQSSYDLMNLLSRLIQSVLGTQIKIRLIAFWATLSVLGIICFNSLLPAIRMHTVSSRKLFHLLVMVMFIPGICFDSGLLLFAQCYALLAFTLLEFLRIRFYNHCLILRVIGAYFCKFLEDKTSASFILSHIYLLVGCSISLIATKLTVVLPTYFYITPMIFLGIGDTMSAICGINYGVKKWPNSKKTIVGTLSGIVASLLFNNMVLVFLWPGKAIMVISNIALICGNVYEGYTHQNDNMMVPLLMVGLQQLMYSVCIF